MHTLVPETGTTTITIERSSAERVAEQLHDVMPHVERLELGRALEGSAEVTVVVCEVFNRSRVSVGGRVWVNKGATA